MITKPAAATRLRGVWLGVKDIDATRAFYEHAGAQFEDDMTGMVHATLGGVQLIIETSPANPHPGSGYFLLFDVTDADALYAELQGAGYAVQGPPMDEQWGRQFNVLDPDGYQLAFIGPVNAAE